MKLNNFGIDPSVIEEKTELAERTVFKYAGAENVHDFIEEAMAEVYEFGIWNDITNSIIYAFFHTAERYIRKHHKAEKKEPQIYTYINGADSHLYVDGREIIMEGKGK